MSTQTPSAIQTELDTYIVEHAAYLGIALKRIAISEHRKLDLVNGMSDEDCRWWLETAKRVVAAQERPGQPVDFTFNLHTKIQCTNCHGTGTAWRHVAGYYGPDECLECHGDGGQDVTLVLDQKGLAELKHALAGEWKCRCGNWFTPDETSRVTGYCSAACFIKFDGYCDPDED